MPGQPVHEVSQREDRLRVQMRFWLLQESEKLRLEPAIGAEPQSREGLEHKERGEAAAPESVLPKGQNGLLRLMEHHFP